MKGWRNFLMLVLILVVALTCGWGTVWYVFSGARVTAIFADTPLTGADVYINDKKVGVTPYQTRFTPGIYTIRVVPPEDYETRQPEQTLHLFTFFRGVDFKAEFDPRVSPVPASE